MVSFLALHRGPSLATAELIAVTTDPELVAYVAGALLREPKDPEASAANDPAVGALRRGRRRALRLVQAEARHAPAMPPEGGR